MPALSSCTGSWHGWRGLLSTLRFSRLLETGGGSGHRRYGRISHGRAFGFCKLIDDRKTYRILGCHVVGERAVDIAQVAAIAMAAGMQVDDLARVALSYPPYAGILVRVVACAACQLGLEVGWQAHQVESTWH